ncbi:MAG: NTP transferase domain-containing protein [Dehalococcoidia bacterium]|nr:NTP transferase domain-containing protein [Dehalococcoidia bacterium]
MKAVILAAGEGKRMHPLTYTRPKAMLPLAAKPFLEHLIIELKKAGIRDILLVVGYHRYKVQSYFGNGKKWGINIDYVSQMKQSGTADALRTVENLLDGKFLVINGDIIINSKDIIKMTANDNPTIGLIEASDTSGRGVVKVDKNRVIGIYEKVKQPPSNLVNTGVYLLTREIFRAISKTHRSPRGEYELTDSLQLLIDGNSCLRYQILDSWLDLSYPWNLLDANERIMPQIASKNLGETEKNVTLQGAVLVGKGTQIRSGSYITGPVIIGENCTIGPNCYIRPFTTIGNSCHIGSAVEVKNSIIMENTKIPHHNYIGDSVIGENCNFGAGTKIANLRLDKRDIEIMGVKTGRRKLGAIIGDGVETGINVSLNVGCTIGNNCFISPGAVANGVLLPDSRII